MSDLYSAYGPLAASPMAPPRYDATSIDSLPNMMSGGAFLPPPVVSTLTDRVARPAPQAPMPAAVAAASEATQGPPMYTRETLWDRMALRRGEIMKMLLLSLIVVLALSVDGVSTHYLTQYVSNGFFTTFQEFMVRISYPVIVILVMWILKAW